MNPDLNSSPLTSAQSWIVENISSLIASNLDDENDCTLTMPNENRNSKQSAPLDQSDEDQSPEVARTLAVAEEHFNGERLTKRPFSPEPIANDNSNGSTINGERLDMFCNDNKFLNQMNRPVSASMISINRVILYIYHIVEVGLSYQLNNGINFQKPIKNYKILKFSVKR